MSISTVLCKLWRWIVKAATAIVDGVVTVVKALVEGAFDILGTLFDGASSLFDGLLSKPLFWVAAGFGLWWLLGSDEEGQTETRTIYGVPTPQR